MNGMLRYTSPRAALLLCAIMLLPTVGLAGPLQQQSAKLVDLGATQGSNAGAAVALSADGNTLIVGGPTDAASMGAAWVFVRSNGTWTQQGDKLNGPGAVGAAEFGHAVAMSADGNTALIGGTADNNNVGAAWVFTRANGAWSPQAKLVASDSSGASFQGTSVALSADGNTALIGGPFDANFTGAAWVFTRSGGVWTQQGSKLAGMDVTGSAAQGGSVSLSADGNTALIGGHGDNSNVGAAWIYTRTSGVWSQFGNKLVGSGAAGAATQGLSVALSADGMTALVGGPTDASNTGAIWVFTFNNGVWSQQGDKLIGNGTAEGLQGDSISISFDGNLAIVGGQMDTAGMGVAWAWVRDNTGAWSLQSKLLGTGAIGTSEQGFAVAVSADGSTVAIGGPGDNNFIGAAWIFAHPAVHDVSGQGKSDIAWRHSGGTAAAWLMDGAQVLHTSSFGAPPLNWQLVGQRDFNADGTSDWLWRDSSTGNTAIWLFSGGQVAQTGLLGVVPTNWSVVGTGDFNADGSADILWRDSSTGTVAIWLMNGLQVQKTGGLGSVPSNWSIVGSDGQGDIFWRDSASGSVVIWQVSNFQVVQSANLGAVPSNWSIVGTADFDANGSTDILWRDSNTGTMAVWLTTADGLGILHTGALGTISGNWVVAETGDFNGDGCADILWRDTANGTVAIWFMNALQVSSAASLGAVPSDWTIQSSNAD